MGDSGRGPLVESADEECCVIVNGLHPPPSWVASFLVDFYHCNALLLHSTGKFRRDDTADKLTCPSWSADRFSSLALLSARSLLFIQS